MKNYYPTLAIICLVTGIMTLASGSHEATGVGLIILSHLWWLDTDINEIREKVNKL